MNDRQSASSNATRQLPSSDDPGPRYVAPAGRAQAAGTSARAVAQAAGLPLRLDRTAALWYMAHDAYDVERSFFEGVAQVPLRSLLERDTDGCVRVQTAPGPARVRATVSVAAELLRARIEAATAERLHGHERAGVLLSGGLDSSVVAAAASRAWRADGRDPGDLVLFHMLPPVGPGEEAHARAVAEHLGHDLISVPPGGPEQPDTPVLPGLDFPTADAAWSPSLSVLDRASGEGISLLLTGDGGDEAVAAYGTPHERGARSALAARARMLVGGVQATARHLLRPYVAKRLRRSSPASLPAWLAGQLDDSGEPRAVPSARAGLRGVAAARDRSLRAARQACLVAWWRAAGALHGLSMGFPLLDAQVVDLVVGLPQRVFATAQRPKDLLRRAFHEWLPSSALERPKDQPYVEPWLRARVAAHAVRWTEEFLVDGRLVQAGLLPRREAEAVLHEAAQGPPEVLYRALAILGTERWCRAAGVVPEGD